MTPIRCGIAALAAIALPALTGCPHNPPPTAGTPPPPPPPCATPEPLRITMEASPQINPGEKGEPLATVVRLYQLKGTTKLQGASFDDLLDRDKQVLADDVVSMSEVTINPGEKLDPPVARGADTAYVAAVALFRRPAGNTWRSMKKLAPPNPQHCHVAGGGAGGAKGATLSEGTVRITLDENRIDLR
jgi:type VI secretion system protein VasD